MGAGTGLAAALMLVGLGFLVFFFVVSMKNAKGSSSNPISNIINSLVPKLNFTVSGGSNVGAQGTGKGSVAPRTGSGSSPMAQGTGQKGVSVIPKLQVTGSGQAMTGPQAGTTAPVKLHSANGNKCEGKSVIQKVFNLC